MKTSETKTSRNRSRGPRRGRRGGRANNNNNGNNGGGNRPPSARSPRPAPKPKTFWEKILAFFSGGSSAKGKPSTSSKPARSSSMPTVDTRPTSAARPVSNDSRSGSSAPRAKRVPEMVEVTSSRLYVGNLSFDAGESDLFELFNGVGQVQYAEVVSNPHTHRSKGFAFVQMQTIEEAKRAVRELHNKDFMGRPLVVSGAKSQREDEPSESPSETASA